VNRRGFGCNTVVGVVSIAALLAFSLVIAFHLAQGVMTLMAATREELADYAPVLVVALVALVGGSLIKGPGRRGSDGSGDSGETIAADDRGDCGGDDGGDGGGDSD
jgi:hypothetical protein